MIIALSGRKRSGKNTTYMLAKLLCDEDETGRVVKVAFADALKVMARQEYGWNGLKDAAGRKLLQELGVGMREQRGENFWVTLWRDTVQALENGSHPPKVIFVTDCRFPNEANTVKEMGGVVWRIERTGLVSEDTHISETALDDYKGFDHYIVANGLDELMHGVKGGLIKLGLYP